MPSSKRLLVLRLSAMGDVAMTVPVLLALSRTYPQLEIIALSRKRFFSILEHIPNITLIEADLASDHKGVPGLYKLSGTLKKQDIHAVADLHNVLRTKILRFFMRGIHVAVIDKGRSDKKKLVSNPAFFKPLTSTHERYAQVFDQLGYPLQLQAGDVYQPLRIPQKVHDLVGSHTCQWIGIAPFAAHASKALSLNKAKELVQAIKKIDRVKMVLFGGGEKECKQLKIVAGTCDHVYNLAGIMSFKEELAMLSNLDAMVSVDTGNGHLAAMYGVPVITLWGNTHPYAGFTPYHQPLENQITANRADFPLIPTSIYGNKVPPGYENVMDTIDCQAVVNRLKTILR